MSVKAIDIHTHGIGGYDTRTTVTEDILEIARIQGSHGVSAILPTIYSGPINEMRKNMAAVKEAMDRQKVGCACHGRTSGGLRVAGQGDSSHVQSTPDSIRGSGRPTSHIFGLHLEGPFLNPLRCGALDPASFLSPTPDNLSRLIEGFEDIVQIITLAPELDGAARLIKTATDKGITVSMGHSDATYAEAEAGFHAGAKGITHIFNAMRPFRHREPGIAGFGLMNRHVYVEMIADPFHLHPETVKLIYAVKDPSKIVIVSDSVRETGVKIGSRKPEGRKERKRSGQKSDAALDMRNSQGILQGGSMTVSRAAERLIQLGIDEDLVLPCIISNPASYLNRK